MGPRITEMAQRGWSSMVPTPECTSRIKNQQNPMDLDYRALGNEGLWLVGRRRARPRREGARLLHQRDQGLQTDADRARVIDGLSDLGGPDGGLSQAELAKAVKMLAQLLFVLERRKVELDRGLQSGRHREASECARLQLDVLACPRCGGRMRHLATIVDTEVAKKIRRALPRSVRRPARGSGPDTQREHRGARPADASVSRAVAW
jgi:hypothetical protein